MTRCPIGSQGNSYANLVAPPGHHIDDNAIKPKRRQKRSQETKADRKHSHKASSSETPSTDQGVSTRVSYMLILFGSAAASSAVLMLSRNKPDCYYSANGCRPRGRCLNSRRSPQE